MADYFAVITEGGLAAIAAAASGGPPVQLAEMAVGDGNGAAIVPEASATGLAGERWRAAINRVFQPDPTGRPSTWAAELAIPATAGGFTMREVGVFAAGGDLFAIGALPPTAKPVPEDGAFTDTVVVVEFAVANGTIEPVLDPATVIATQGWVTLTITTAWMLPGGSTGQVLTKASNTDGDVTWSTPATPSIDFSDFLNKSANLDDVPDKPQAVINLGIPAMIPDGVPPGAVMAFARPTAPSGWLVCDGRAVSRATHATLFAAIGTLWGDGNGVDTFNLPDLRGEFLRGADQGRGADPGRTVGTAQAGRSNSLSAVENFAAGRQAAITLPADGAWSVPVQRGEGVDPPRGLRFRLSGGETRPRNAAVLWCIRT